MISNLDRNDMSYVPATTIKNGRTLSLAGVEWQVTGTDLVGETLSPSSWQAVATYTASTSWQAATGYVTTAEYHGEVVSEGIESVTYTVVYTGAETLPAEGENPSSNGTNPFAALAGSPLLPIGGFMLLALAAGFGVLLFTRRKNVYVYIPGDRPRDYKLIAKFRADAKYPNIDLRQTEPYPTGVVAIEVKRSLAKELVGQNFTVQCQEGDYVYAVLRGDGDDWHEFNVDTLTPIT